MASGCCIGTWGSACAKIIKESTTKSLARRRTIELKQEKGKDRRMREVIWRRGDQGCVALRTTLVRNGIAIEDFCLGRAAVNRGVVHGMIKDYIDRTSAHDESQYLVLKCSADFVRNNPVPAGVGHGHI
jgi:hypothetical protein